MNLDAIKTIYLLEDKSYFKTKKYNGSWYPIVMETTDGLDYSIPVYENWYSFIDDFSYDEETGEEIELTDEQLSELFKEFITHMENWGWEIKTK